MNYKLNNLANWLLKYFPTVSEEGGGYFERVAEINQSSESKQEKAELLEELDRTYPTSSLWVYFQIKIVNFANKRPIVACGLALGVLYNIAYFLVVFARYLGHAFS